MKALTFTEFYKEKLRNVGSGEAEDNLALVNRYLDFVSQTFKPEMILDMFEGWASNKPKNNFYNKDFGIWFYENTMRIRDTKISVYETIIPLTLEQFISDYQRAGIELTFKEEEIENQFLN